MVKSDRNYMLANFESHRIDSERQTQIFVAFLAETHLPGMPYIAMGQKIYLIG